MSEVTASPRSAFACAGVVACSSLRLGVVAMSTAGCLITSTPQFQAEQHTPPFLVASTAIPDVRKVVVVDKSQPMALKFSADVVSQDDPADSTGQFQQVSWVLYIDYGVPAEPGLPYLYPFIGGTLPPGTLDQSMARTVTSTWYPTVYPVQAGCHTATLTVSHIFDKNPNDPVCPLCESDSSSITWQVLSCDSSIMGDCDNLPIGGSGACAYQLDPSQTVTCAQVEAELGAVCPDAADAGAP